MVRKATEGDTIKTRKEVLMNVAIQAYTNNSENSDDFCHMSK